MENKHYEALETMYLIAPINQLFTPEIIITDKTAVITMKTKKNYWHGGKAAHGCIYFKMIDDAAYFASMSIENEVLLLTKCFNTHFVKPVSSCMIKSIGKVTNSSNGRIIADSGIYNEAGEMIGHGQGVFVKSKMLLLEAGYPELKVIDTRQL